MFFGLQHSSGLSCHLNWHAAIYHIENGDYQAARDIFDKRVIHCFLYFNSFCMKCTEKQI